MPSFVRRIPEGDNRERQVCAECGFVAYENPKVVVGSVVAHRGRVLLCRRAIEPRLGFWTLPAGYLEHGETVQEGACREAWEEAQARIVIEGILAVFSISRLGQVQVMFRAGFADAGADEDADGGADGGADPPFAAGPESQDVALFAWDGIPWDDIAFPSVRWALEAWRAVLGAPLGAPAGNPPEDPRGTRHLGIGRLGIAAS